MQVSNFDEATDVKIILKITSKALFYMAYSTYQEWLFERVCHLRDVENSLLTQSLKESHQRASSQLEASNSSLKVPSQHTKRAISESKDLLQNQTTLLNLLSTDRPKY